MITILIDEARIPLIIAGSTNDTEDRTKLAAEIIATLEKDDYELDEYERNVTLSETGLDKVESALKGINLYVMQRVERDIVLYHLNEGWSGYLEEVGSIREGIHLTGFAGKNPLDEFHMTVIPLFNEVLKSIDEAIIMCFEEAEITDNGIDLQKEGLKGPSSTWTYLVEDNPFGNDGLFIRFVKKTGSLALTTFKKMLAWPGKMLKQLLTGRQSKTRVEKQS